MFKTIAILTALVIGTASMAKADIISINGSVNYDPTNTTLTFTGPTVGGYPYGSVGGTSTGIFSAFQDCFGCVQLQNQTLNYGNFVGPYSVFHISATPGNGNQDLLVTFTSITSVLNNLEITGDAIININGVVTPGILDLTTQGSKGGPVNVTFSATTSTVPEPESLALFGTGLLGIVGLARRKFNV
ncbi:PEP-CTERM sorting domain-containing protein [Edaphobacter sp.]|uniref:PEP-CTERM sorting domain-containing protein n=1 Tax=Edaphobacter sp. TaxID=1934404 RepID=UPI002DB9172F|nr:PEP-CTERM sorting domain-containing protein [Edaphobacter sp.]HEU5342488.1 PEP-CTERM sorting domain-containing protein [Edaphobacter sp.]